MAKGKKRKASPGDVATNRQASYRYNLLERFEAGLVLTGTEVKSLREGKAQLKDAYAMVRDGEVWLMGSTQERGLTLVPTRMYFAGPRSRAKVEIAIARGKDLYDKRESIRKREMARDVQRELREAHR